MLCNKKLWLELENVLNQNKCSFWWRDDDVRASKPKFCKSNIKFNFRLKKTLLLLNKYNISGVFAVIPDLFFENGKKQIELLKKYGAFVTIHGIKHENNNCSNFKNEFPDEYDFDAGLEFGSASCR